MKTLGRSQACWQLMIFFKIFSKFIFRSSSCGIFELFKRKLYHVLLSSLICVWQMYPKCKIKNVFLNKPVVELIIVLISF